MNVDRKSVPVVEVGPIIIMSGARYTPTDGEYEIRKILLATILAVSLSMSGAPSRSEPFSVGVVVTIAVADWVINPVLTAFGGLVLNAIIRSGCDDAKPANAIGGGGGSRTIGPFLV